MTALSCFVILALALQVAVGARFEYRGCYEDRWERAFEYGPHQDDRLTPTSCYRHCKNAGVYKYFGLQNGNECYCGSGSYDRYGSAADNRCGHHCQGDGSVKCGGHWANSVYEYDGGDPDFDPDLKFLGCYLDGRNPIERTMIYVKTSDKMTVKKCVKMCEKRKYRFAGLQYENECWCSDNKEWKEGGKQPDSRCDKCCSGGGGCDNTCGGTHAHSVYTRGGEGGGNMKPRFKYMGCYQDDGGWRTMERILDSPKLTVKICIAECKERGFRFAGIQNSNECYCSKNRSFARIGEVDNHRCNMCCQGDPFGGGGACNYPCGSGWINSVYRT